MHTAEHTTHQTSHTPYTFIGAFKLFGLSITILKRNIVTLIGLLFTPMALALPLVVAFSVLGITMESTSDVAAFIGFFLLFVFLVALMGLVIILGPAITFVLLRSAQGHEVEYGPAFGTGRRYMWRFIGLGIVSGLIIMAGFLLLIVPGFFMLRRYVLAPYYLIDRDLKIREAMKQSARDSKQFSRPLWGLIGVQILTSIVSFVPLVGFIAQLLYAGAPAARYSEIKHASGYRHPSEIAAEHGSLYAPAR